jgi:hypothetical protein
MPQLYGNAHIENVTAGEAITAPAWVYVDATDHKMYKASASSTTNPAVGLVFATVASGDVGQIAFSGVIEWDYLTPISAANVYYLSSSTAGAQTVTAPTNKQHLAYAVSATRLLINPQPFAESGGGGSDGNGIYSGSGEVPFPSRQLYTFPGGYGYLVKGMTNGTSDVPYIFDGLMTLDADVSSYDTDDASTIISSAGNTTAIVYNAEESSCEVRTYISGVEKFVMNLSTGYVRDDRATQNGLTYNDDYSATIAANDRSIPDVATVKQIARPYKVYTALLTQTGTDAPTATVLENTLGGTVTWSYDDSGRYLASFGSSLFLSGKTFIVCGSVNDGDPNNGSAVVCERVSDTSVKVITTVLNSLSDYALNGTPFEIRIYP